MSVLTSKDITFTAGNHRYHITDTKPKVYIPSVTTICGLLDKPFLVEWAAREAATAAIGAYAEHEGQIEEETLLDFIEVGRKAHREQRDEGANVGTAVHNAIKERLVPGWSTPAEQHVDGGMDADLAMTAFDEWYEEYVLGRGAKALLCEQIVVHPSGKYVGTPDLVLQVPDGNSPTGSFLEINDFKTSNQSDSNPCAVYVEYLFQLAAYRLALMETPEFDGLFGPHPWGGGRMVALGKNGQMVCTPVEAEDLDMFAEAFLHMAEVIATYRHAEKIIRAANKAEKQRRELLVAVTEES